MSTRVRRLKGELPEHGTPARYNHHRCRCVPCVRAKKRREIDYLTGTRYYVSAAGSRRRLQALACMGWSMRELGERSGVNLRTLDHWRAGRTTRMHPEHADIIANLFRQLWDQPGPSHITKGWARKHGWAPPLAWDNIDDEHEQPKGLRYAEETAA